MNRGVYAPLEGMIVMKIQNVVSAVCGTIIKIAVAVVVVAFIYNTAMKGYDFGYRVFDQEPVSLGEGRTVTVSVTENMSVSEMGNMLYEKGLIKDTTLFLAQYYLSEFRESIKPGIYELNTSMTPEEMFEVMATQTEKEGSGS